LVVEIQAGYVAIDLNLTLADVALM